MYNAIHFDLPLLLKELAKKYSSLLFSPDGFQAEAKNHQDKLNRNHQN